MALMGFPSRAMVSYQRSTTIKGCICAAFGCHLLPRLHHGGFGCLWEWKRVGPVLGMSLFARGCDLLRGSGKENLWGKRLHETGPHSGLPVLPWGAGWLACSPMFSGRIPCKRLRNVCSKSRTEFFVLLCKNTTNENRQALWVNSRCP